MITNAPSALTPKIDRKCAFKPLKMEPEFASTINDRLSTNQSVPSIL